MADTRLDSLPEECLAHIISFTSPRDACLSSLISGSFRDAADSDLAWEKFLPSDYREIISRSVYPVEYSSNKELFRKLSSTPLLIDGGNKTILIDRYNNKKCYMLSARGLSITWSSHSLCWCWKSLLHSRFHEAVELIMVCWLEIKGKINTKILSPNTTYGVYLVIQLANRAFGLDSLPSEIEVQVGDYKTRGTICVKRDERVLCARDDGWLEVELGEFYNDESGKEVIMTFKEIKGEQLKGGLIVEGIELKPKY
ncbi:hypothetical protein BUALT_Bualt15G0119700 [Buddleja alternifolia]|uniref:F-box domain-containing protein n=1 Tax=Buddleja alternifolia TaxID=168488 RepID=A0AAV6WQ86_9LAMI|nr:hypothetical protein BUALT_Bualt15G0119700 [Buddleja alternifolia]